MRPYAPSTRAHTHTHTRKVAGVNSASGRNNGVCVRDGSIHRALLNSAVLFLTSPPMTGGRHPDTGYTTTSARMSALKARGIASRLGNNRCDAPELGLFISSFDRILKRNAEDNERSINPKNDQLRNLEHSLKHSSLRTERSRN